MTLSQRIDVAEIKHSLVFQIPSASIDGLQEKVSFPKVSGTGMSSLIFLISSAELSDDCVSKFTSFVRARD